MAAEIAAKRPAPRRAEADCRGQAIAEFALVLIPFLFLLFGVFDLGRGIYQYNGVAEAAREIARVTIVHPYAACCTLGSSSQALAVITKQEAVVPGLSAAGITIVCVDLDDQAVAAASCRPGNYIKVTVRVAWTPSSPLLMFLGLHELSSVSRMEYQFVE